MSDSEFLAELARTIQYHEMLHKELFGQTYEATLAEDAAEQQIVERLSEMGQP